ncbi:MAG: hypothetical protein QOF55_114 [Thermoleophilaceae bacterium]|jgi:predicted nucleic acid-binding protein|nr:hypothetical protein [Thermoleophilaceae bacterium]
MLVIDASALADLLLDLPPAGEVARHLHEYEYALAAPHVLDLEVLSALRRAVASAQTSAGRADEAVDDLLDLSLERYPHHLLTPRIWELRTNFSPYDAAYLALAEALTDEGSALLTTDARFARAARRHSDVEVLLAA